MNALIAFMVLGIASNGKPVYECTYQTANGPLTTYEVGGCGPLDEDDVITDESVLRGPRGD